MTVKGRIAYGLLRLKERFGVTRDGLLNISLTRQDLASYVGTTYETAFRVLTELSRENIISFLEKDICIINEAALSNIT
jgi:CRP/FNR family transcriptional regulator